MIHEEPLERHLAPADIIIGCFVEGGWRRVEVRELTYRM